MINGFSEETAPLNDYEKDTLLPVIVCGLKTKRGSSMAVKNAYICSRLKAAGYKVTEARIRKIINHIRVNGIVPLLIATSAGYYIATNVKEVEDYIDSLYGREKAISEVRMALTEQLRQAGSK